MRTNVVTIHDVDGDKLDIKDALVYTGTGYLGGWDNIGSFKAVDVNFLYGDYISGVTVTTNVALQIDEHQNPVYVGMATAGTGVSESYWRIQKNTFNAVNSIVAINWAGGSNTANKVWNDRLTYTYS